MEIAIVPTGPANVASVMSGLSRLRMTPVMVESPQKIHTARVLVLPGVGAFAAAKQTLIEQRMWEPLRQRLLAKRPTLAVCLGLQLLAEESEEAPGEPGLGVLPGKVTRFSGDLVVPQMGWNRVDPAGFSAVHPGFAYFANSYRLTEAPSGWHVSFAEHGGRFVAAAQQGPILACQFHPELSGSWGEEMLERWLQMARGDTLSMQPPDPVEGPAGLTNRVIPCLDVSGGRVVKGVQFQGLRDAGDPATLAEAYAQQGADEIVILDVSATPEGRGHQTETTEAVRRAINVPLTVGGGVRTVADADRLLAAGADKVAINTKAVEEPEILTALAERFGRQCIVLALDAAQSGDSWEVVTRSGKNRTGIDAVDWARRAQSLGAGEILLTSWDRDGTRSGYDTALLAAVRDAVAVPVIASGGADTAQHMADALNAGADAVLAASIFHDQHTTVGKIKDQLLELGVEVRR